MPVGPFILTTLAIPIQFPANDWQMTLSPDDFEDPGQFRQSRPYSEYFF
jgi:hypothetical protein